jgi:hypothetical protein
MIDILKFGLFLLLMYLELAILIIAAVMFVRDIRGRESQAAWPWQVQWYREWWKDIRVGLLWPYLLYRRNRPR